MGRSGSRDRTAGDCGWWPEAYKPSDAHPPRVPRTPKPESAQPTSTSCLPRHVSRLQRTSETHDVGNWMCVSRTERAGNMEEGAIPVPDSTKLIRCSIWPLLNRIFALASVSKLKSTHSSVQSMDNEENNSHAGPFWVAANCISRYPSTRSVRGPGHLADRV